MINQNNIADKYKVKNDNNVEKHILKRIQKRVLSRCDVIVIFCFFPFSENRKVSHYIITQRNGQYQIGDQTFNDLPEIVDFYRRHFLDTTTLVEAVSDIFI